MSALDNQEILRKLFYACMTEHEMELRLPNLRLRQAQKVRDKIQELKQTMLRDKNLPAAVNIKKLRAIQVEIVKLPELWAQVSIVNYCEDDIPYHNPNLEV